MVLLVGFVAACGGRVAYHEVREGETLFRIGRAYGIPYQEIARANRLSDPSQIRVGQRLRIPGATRLVRVSAVGRADETGTRPEAAPLPKDAPRFDWPIPHGTITSGFGPRRGGFHDGIDIAAPMGAAVRAAADGEVTYSASVPGYGNVIVVRHSDGFATVYAHNDRHHVRAGQRVRRGQLIGTVGRSGRASGPSLHFEVRRDSVAQDPRPLLPRKARPERAVTLLEGE